MRSAEAMVRGVVFVHSCPKALMPHVEWAVQRAVDRAPLRLVGQPILNGMFRCEIQWFGAPGAGAQIASALRGFRTYVSR